MLKRCWSIINSLAIVTLLASACQSTSQDVPYRAWQPIFRSLLNLQPGQPDPTAFLETALQDRNRQWGERTPLLGALLGLVLPDNPTTAALDARLRYEATQTLAVDLLQSVALEQPLLLVLDDIHWMDEAGKDLMLAVGRITAGMTCTLCLLERSSRDASPERNRQCCRARLHGAARRTRRPDPEPDALRVPGAGHQGDGFYPACARPPWPPHQRQPLRASSGFPGRQVGLRPC